MKTKNLVIALALTVALMVVALNVWASSGRQGTVPPVPGEFSFALSPTCDPLLARDIGIGTVALCGTGEAKIEVKTFEDLKNEGQDYPPVEGWQYLVTDAIIITAPGAQLGEVCVPFIPEWKDKKANETIGWYWWNAKLREKDPNANAWVALETTIKENTTPPFICGKFAVNKPEGFTFEQPVILSLQGK
jgi:hypothetical protein